MKPQRLHVALLCALSITLLLGHSYQKPKHQEVVTVSASSAATHPFWDVPVLRLPERHETARVAAQEATKPVPLQTTTTTQPPPPTTTTTTAKPEPPPPPVPVSEIEKIIARYFPNNYGEARAIAECESHMNPSAVSPTNDHGLFQINAQHRASFESVTGHPWSDVYDPAVNSQFAKWMYDRSGWGPWSCRYVLN